LPNILSKELLITGLLVRFQRGACLNINDLQYIWCDLSRGGSALRSVSAEFRLRIGFTALFGGA
jgi:hypothetical protein